jgi:TfoX/Sxy family transcriptional regulator of competence genes
MAWVKIPKENHEVLARALPVDDRLETKAMFGGLAAMLNGHMLAGLFGTSAMVKLGAREHAALAALGGTPFDPMGDGRAMSEALVLPQAEFDDRARLAGWLAKARDHVASLPPKKARSASPKKASPKKASPTKGSATPTATPR